MNTLILKKDGNILIKIFGCGRDVDRIFGAVLKESWDSNSRIDFHIIFE